MPVINQQPVTTTLPTSIVRSDCDHTVVNYSSYYDYQKQNPPTPYYPQ